jgi:hypothetical protein
MGLVITLVAVAVFGTLGTAFAVKEGLLSVGRIGGGNATVTRAPRVKGRRVRVHRFDR